MGRIVEFNEDDVIISEGEINECIYLILEGAVSLYFNYGKKDEYVLGVCGKNKCFGEMGALVKDTSIYTVVAFNHVKCMMFSEDELGQFLKECPNQAIALLKNLAINSRLFRENCKMILNERDEAVRDQDIYRNIMNHGRSSSINEALSKYSLFERF